MKLGLALLAVVLLVVEGGLVLSWFTAPPDAKAAGPGGWINIGIFFAVAVISFFGSLFLSRELRAPEGRIDDGDVRLAIAASFVLVFFALLSFFLFLPDQRSQFARDAAGQLFALMGLVVGFYFATTGALEFAKIRERRTGRRLEDDRDETANTTATGTNVASGSRVRTPSGGA